MTKFSQKLTRMKCVSWRIQEIQNQMQNLDFSKSLLLPQTGGAQKYVTRVKDAVIV